METPALAMNEDYISNRHIIKEKIEKQPILSEKATFAPYIPMDKSRGFTAHLVKADQDLWPTDILIENLHTAGLPVPSVIRFKMFTLDHRLILGRLGRLSEADRDRVQQKLKEIFIL